MAGYVLSVNIASTYNFDNNYSNFSNLALSLGMIGALSIVRYRTPIKSVYELALLFFLITLGVAGGVSIKYAIFFTIFLIFTPFFV